MSMDFLILIYRTAIFIYYIYYNYVKLALVRASGARTLTLSSCCCCCQVFHFNLQKNRICGCARNQGKAVGTSPVAAAVAVF